MSVLSVLGYGVNVLSRGKYPQYLGCTNLGGDSPAKTAKEIAAKLTQKHFYKSC
jgi:hypothetical protein